MWPNKDGRQEQKWPGSSITCISFSISFSRFSSLIFNIYWCEIFQEHRSHPNLHFEPETAHLYGWYRMP